MYQGVALLGRAASLGCCHCGQCCCPLLQPPASILTPDSITPRGWSCAAQHPAAGLLSARSAAARSLGLMGTVPGRRCQAGGAGACRSCHGNAALQYLCRLPGPACSPVPTKQLDCSRDGTVPAHCRDPRAAAWEHPSSLSVLTLQHAVVQRAAILSAGLRPPGGCRAPCRLWGWHPVMSAPGGGVSRKDPHSSSTLWICSLGSGSRLCSAQDVPAVRVALAAQGCPGAELCCLMWGCSHGAHPAAQRSVCCFAVCFPPRPCCRTWCSLSCVAPRLFPQAASAALMGVPLPPRLCTITAHFLLHLSRAPCSLLQPGTNTRWVLSVYRNQLLRASTDSFVSLSLCRFPGRRQRQQTGEC